MNESIVTRPSQLVPVLFFVTIFAFSSIHFIPDDAAEALLGENEAVNASLD